MLRHLAMPATLVFALTASAQEPVTIEVMETAESGPYLAVGERPVYLFSSDERGEGANAPVVSCIDECQEAWPRVTGPAVAGHGVEEGLLGATDYGGQRIVTYNGWPLYQFERDVEGGPPTGQEFESFGGSWLLVRPDGTPVIGEGV